ncbi:carbon-nitrogen hydrolase family protein [Rubellimicrobium aerolatum]|uniref:Carbon-nitrogen hydrolase family protein n=1 Tax=Rubellimicrobium aerolatum TaxID=490979 RepID=A0ABW0SE63_9RHOB|nr:carbon-nitrogen hydrolase family protein [Rubellimicrobium aerolatum]MBP1806842.1 putative amidohydrolase [Rubellimicrobium aerolatum]
MRLALWQGEGVAGDPAATLAEIDRAATLAARDGADLLLFPEGFLTGYHLPTLRPDDLPWVEDALAQVGRIVARAGLSVVLGTHVPEGRTLRNAAIAFDATGTELGRYGKRALFGQWERATFAPGRAPFLFDCAGLRVAIAICYDVEFPELIRPSAQAGADLVVVPTALMAPHDRIARQVVPVRAMESQVFLAYCNRTGHEHGLDYVGLSRICGPRGETLAEAGAGPQLLRADLSREVLRRERAENSYLDDLARLSAPDG